MRPTPGELYQHLSGNFYLVVGVGRNAVTGEKMVCYQTPGTEIYLFRSLYGWTETVEDGAGNRIPTFRLVTAGDSKDGEVKHDTRQGLGTV